MEILNSKWFLFTAIPILILVVLYVIGSKSVHTEVNIKANTKAVWQVLTDIKKAKEWNTVLVPIKGELKEGTKVKYSFSQEGSKPMEMDAKVVQLTPEKLINQKGGMPFVLTFNHRYIIEADGENTKLTIHEDYKGIMVPFWNTNPVQKAYEKLINQVKERVEK